MCWVAYHCAFCIVLLLVKKLFSVCRWSILLLTPGWNRIGLSCFKIGVLLRTDADCILDPKLVLWLSFKARTCGQQSKCDWKTTNLLAFWYCFVTCKTVIFCWQKKYPLPYSWLNSHKSITPCEISVWHWLHLNPKLVLWWLFIFTLFFQWTRTFSQIAWFQNMHETFFFACHSVAYH